VRGLAPASRARTLSIWAWIVASRLAASCPERANLAPARGKSRSDNEIGAQPDDRLDVGREEAADPRQMRHLGRIVAILRDADHFVACAQGEKRFGDRGRERHDTPWRIRCGRGGAGDRKCGGGQQGKRSAAHQDDARGRGFADAGHPAKLPDPVRRRKRPAAAGIALHPRSRLG